MVQVDPMSNKSKKLVQEIYNAISLADGKANAVNKNIEELRSEIYRIGLQVQGKASGTANNLYEQISNLSTQFKALSSERKKLNDCAEKGWAHFYCSFFGSIFKERIKSCDMLMQSITNQNLQLNALLREFGARSQIEIAELEQNVKNVESQFADNWDAVLQPLRELCQKISVKQSSLSNFEREHLKTPNGIPPWIIFGHWKLLFDVMEFKQWSETVPHLIDFPFTAPFFDVGTHNKKRIHSLLLCLLFALPVGMVELTIIDPVKMGQSIEDFLPLLDIEKLVPQKRCLTHPDKIEKALLELFDYSAEQLQTRLRSTDWLRYNETNRENPLPYKVLLIFDYPDQITSKGATYLKRILENGMKCGILPIIWITEDGLDQIDQIESRANPADKALLDVMRILQEQGQHLGERYDDEGGFEFPRKLNALEAKFVHESFPKDELPKYVTWIAEAYDSD